MRTLGVYLIYASVVLRAVVVLVNRSEFHLSMILLAVYGLILSSATLIANRPSSPFRSSYRWQFAYLVLQSFLVIGVLIVSSYEDFLAMLFVPLGLDAVSFFGKRLGYLSIAILSLAIIVTLLYSDVGPLFGLAMGVLYSGVCFLFGGYAHQVQKAEAAHTQNQRTFDELQAAHRLLQGYADQRASLAVEQERNRLARELHDSVTQTVFSMNLAAQSARLLFDREPPFDTPYRAVRTAPHVTGQLLHIEELAASALREIQSLVSQLRPRSLVEDGLPAALRRLAEQMAKNGLQVLLEVHGEKTLSEAVGTGLYSIAHEALVNVSKHSGSCEAMVRLNLTKDRSSLEIEDHGRGFDTEAVMDRRGHLGLAGMSERAREIGWSLSIWSRQGQGTRLHVTEHPKGVSG
jgi:signal transduction histidine kinase